MHIYKDDLALNHLKWLMCHKTKPNHLFKVEDGTY